VVLLNKTDLVPVQKIDELERYLQATKAGARIIRCQRGKVPLPLILDVGYTDIKAYDALLQSADHSAEHHHQHDHEHDHHHHEHHSDHLVNDGFVSVSFTSDRPFNLVKFQHFLDDLNPDIFRGKGILWFAESQLRHIFQLSGKRCSMEVDDWKMPRSNQLVFIGRNLDAAQIQHDLDQCRELDLVELRQFK
ncbi:MAG: GTP-binding protein, partial [Leptolyngbyaceae cyanobacterium CAN_BIN12]|nr:GTP-binding protein [Leptolyngbyaceae cyanobacterium CAN_BIN12]